MCRGVDGGADVCVCVCLPCGRRAWVARSIYACAQGWQGMGMGIEVCMYLGGWRGMCVALSVSLSVCLCLDAHVSGGCLTGHGHGYGCTQACMHACRGLAGHVYGYAEREWEY